MLFEILWFGSRRRLPRGRKQTSTPRRNSPTRLGAALTAARVALGRSGRLHSFTRLPEPPADDVRRRKAPW